MFSDPTSASPLLAIAKSTCLRAQSLCLRTSQVRRKGKKKEKGPAIELEFRIYALTKFQSRKPLTNLHLPSPLCAGIISFKVSDMEILHNRYTLVLQKIRAHSKDLTLMFQFISLNLIQYRKTKK